MKKNSGLNKTLSNLIPNHIQYNMYVNKTVAAERYQVI